MNLFHMAVQDGSLRLVDGSSPAFYYTLVTTSLTYRAQRQLSPTRRNLPDQSYLGKLSEVGHFMRPTDHVQMVTSWCELTLRLCWSSWNQWDAWEDCPTLKVFLYSHHIHKRPWAQQWQLVTDWLYSYRYIYLLSTLGSTTIFGFLQLPSASFDFTRMLLTVARYDISLAIFR